MNITGEKPIINCTNRSRNFKKMPVESCQGCVLLLEKLEIENCPK